MQRTGCIGCLSARREGTDRIATATFVCSSQDFTCSNQIDRDSMPGFLYKRGPSSELPSDTDTSQQPSQDDMSQEAKDLHRCPKCTFIDKPVYIPKHSESDAKLDNETILQLRCSYFAP